MKETHNQLLEFFREYQEKEGKPPTMDEAREAIDGLNWRSSVLWALKRLEHSGLMERRKEQYYSRRYSAKLDNEHAEKFGSNPRTTSEDRTERDTPEHDGEAAREHGASEDDNGVQGPREISSSISSASSDKDNSGGTLP